MYFIDLKEILTEEYPLYAHVKDGEKEFLEEHIERCKFYFQKLYDEKELEKIVLRFAKKMQFSHFDEAFVLIRKMLFQIIVFHDFGKLNPVFQRQKMRNERAPERFRSLSGAEHSMLSSIIYIDYFWNEIENAILFDRQEKRKLRLIVLEHAFVIARHHSDLESLEKYLERLESSEVKDLIISLREKHLEGYKGLMYLKDDTIEKNIKRKKLYNRKNCLSREQSITKYFYYRLLYSLLVACDYHATTEFMQKMRNEDFGHTFCIDEFQESYQKSSIMKSIQKYKCEKYQGKEKNLQNIKDINELRSEIFLDTEDELKKCMQEEDSIFFLEAPTGSGKSNTAINLSFQLMKDKKKLFYIYPFNTLVEQNRQTLQELFPKKELQDKIAVVNSLTPIKEIKNDDEDSEKYYQKALLDRQFLNYNFILSTHVSFFNLLFGHKKEDVFGFFQITDSVIVLDEIQSYKNIIWAEIIIFLKNCAQLMGLKIIIMSATLPNLEVLGGDECNVTYLLPESKIYFQHPIFRDRVKACYELLEQKTSLDILLAHVVKHQCQNKKILIEFIKKDTAYSFYQKLCENQDIKVPVLCMTGDDSIYEREKLLKPIRQNELTGVILVATQVIEAGVDIDMDFGYKDISKMDSEEQFMGRINRSCKKAGEVYFFDLDDSHKIYENDYRMDESFTLKEREMREVLKKKDFSFYYHKILEVLKVNQNNSTSRDGLKYFFEEIVAKLDFPKIEEKMRLIENNNWSMDVVLCRTLDLEDGTILDGENVWKQYKELLCDRKMNYAKRQIELSKIRSQLNYFVYQIRYNYDLAYNDIIGELRCIYNGEKYFEYGKISREKLETDNMMFFDF